MAFGYNIHQVKNDTRQALEDSLMQLVQIPCFASSRKKPEAFLQAQSVAARRIYNSLTDEMRAAIDEFISGERDHVVFRGMPLQEVLEPTPTRINAKSEVSIAQVQLAGLAMLFGRPINSYGIANTIRFDIHNNGICEEETWHAHPQSAATMFFCLRGDINAKTKLLSAKDVYNSADEGTKAALLRDDLYIAGLEPFPILKQDGNRFLFSEHLFETSSVIQAVIPNLHLPDMKKMLSVLVANESSSYSKLGLKWVLECLQKTPEIVYSPGDFAIYDECATVRHSPSFQRSVEQPQSRWLKVIGSDHMPFFETPNAALIEGNLQALIATKQVRSI